MKELMDLAPELPWAPVIQGWTWGDYMRHTDAWQREGFDLSTFAAVGVGSICRRQATMRATTILACLQDTKAKLHGLGFKTRGLVAAQDFLWSADSLAWSYNARRKPPLPGCEHVRCNNCLRFALRWRRKVMQLLGKDDGPPAEPFREPLLFP